MGKEEVLDFDEFLFMKENRRISSEKEKANKSKGKRRNVKKIEYNPFLNYEEYNYEDYDIN